MVLQDGGGRVLVFGETPVLARRWLEANGHDPRGRGVYVVNDRRGGRGFNIAPEDRVVFVGMVQLHPDFHDVLFSLLPTMSGVGGFRKIEWVA